MNIATEIARFE